MECGYCEPVCPSKDLTTTPRQRIVLRREMEHARSVGDVALLTELQDEYEYDAVDTCAVDGMCQTACPVLINTGDLVKRLRADNAGRLAGKGWATAAKHWAGTTRAASAALTTAGKLPARLVTVPNRLGRKVIDADTLPLWSPELPAGGPRRDSGAAAERRSRSRGAIRRRGVLHRLRRDHVRPERGRPRGAGIVRADLFPGRHHPGVPGRSARPVLRNPLALQGNEGRVRRDGRPGAARAVAGQSSRARCRSCVTPPRAPKACGRCWRPRSPLPTARYAALRIVDAVAFVEETCAAEAVADPQGRSDGAAPDLLVDPDGTERLAAGGGGGGRRHRHRPGQLGVLRVRRRPRPAASGADRIGHRRAGRRTGGRPLRCVRLVQPHLRAGHDQGDGGAVPARAGTGGLGEHRATEHRSRARASRSVSARAAGRAGSVATVSHRAGDGPATARRRARDARRFTALPQTRTSCQTPLLFLERS